VKNRVLRRIFGPKRNEVIGGWRKFHIKEIHNLYPSPNIMIKSREDEMGKVYCTHGSEDEYIYEYEGKARRKWTTRKT
jgi:hypothetical protein